MVTGGSPGAVGGRVDPDFDDRGVDVWVGYICLDPVMVGEVGLRLPGGTATSFGPPWKLLAGLEAAQKTGPPPAV